MVADRIFTTFNFLVEIEVNSPEFSAEEVCQAAFSECDGLELSMEPKTFQQGGANTEQVHLAGQITYSQLTLKRGMSKDFGLWRWFTETMKTSQRGLRGQVTISMLDGAGNPQMIFQLKNCLPIKLRAPTLNATEGSVAIEEMQLVYAGMTMEFPSATGSEGADGSGGGGTANVNARAGGSIGASAGANIGASAGGSIGASAGASIGANASVGTRIQGGFG